MAILLADVGGTNARMALARDGALDTGAITRFRGDDHATFDDVVVKYLAQQGSPRIEAVCVAVAGPVWGDEARLTNRDWTFSEARLRALSGAPRARLINDLIALGYATPALDGEAAGFLRAAPKGALSNGQRLVVNAGTGFNVCAVKVLPEGGIACLESEEGHTRLPQSVAEPLIAALGEAGRAIDSVEELFGAAVLPGCTVCAWASLRAGPRRWLRPPPGAMTWPRRRLPFMRGCLACSAANLPCGSCRWTGCFWLAAWRVPAQTGSGYSSVLSCPIR